MTDPKPVDRVLKIRPWHDWRWVAAVAALIGVVSVGAFAVTSVVTAQDINRFQPVVSRLDGLATDNAKAIQRIDSTLAGVERNQAGIDELVSFVHDLQAQEGQGGGGDSQMFVDLLCASEDEVRLAACERLRTTGKVNP